MASAVATISGTLKLLSDPVRLRLCALLARAELAVQELVAITGLQQSRVSNHLSRLKRAGFVRDRREGTWSFHSLAEPSERGPLTPTMYAATIAPSLASSEGLADALALAAVLDQRRSRSREAHDQLAQRWQEVGQDFAQGSLRAEALALAFPCGRKVADLGCGAGFLALWLAARGAQVVAVDHSEGLLAAAQSAGGSLVDADAVAFRRGELDALPIADGEVDAAFCNLVWHHLPDHDTAAREMFRAVRAGGAVVVSDLAPHDREWMREAMGDLRLGLKPEQIVVALARAGFVDLQVENACDRYCVTAPDGERTEFPMFLVRGRKPVDAP
jgi:SAM-dependent methyltransferase